MNAVRKQREWTPEQRAAQGQKLRERKIWLVSTGPRTHEGKSNSSRNSVKHGRRSARYVADRHYMAALLRRFREWRKLYVEIQKTRLAVPNELIEFMTRETAALDLMTQNLPNFDYLDGLPPPKSPKCPI